MNAHPHARGGAPPCEWTYDRCCSSSPRTWGCTVPATDRERDHEPHPHARGGAPDWDVAFIVEPLSSPRTWGCTGSRASDRRISPLIPTHVGVHRWGNDRPHRPQPHPHARGGAPSSLEVALETLASSPRTWGCTAILPLDNRGVGLIPTHVGVHRRGHRREQASGPHPHARGGAPEPPSSIPPPPPSSPRTWGCTAEHIEVKHVVLLIPTHVGVHRRRAGSGRRSSPHPHARGGAPLARFRAQQLQRSSPRTWGCTASFRQSSRSASLIPTHVGVHRGHGRAPLLGRPHPHARGGAPHREAARPQLVPHPHARGGAPDNCKLPVYKPKSSPRT